jgi:hypothetical protein
MDCTQKEGSFDEWMDRRQMEGLMDGSDSERSFCLWLDGLESN